MNRPASSRPELERFTAAGVTETHLLDTHDGPVCDDVWGLYRKAHELSGGRSTLMEWDGNIPSFEEVRAEAWKAKAIRGEPEQQHA